MNKPSHEYCKDCKDWNGNISKCMEICGIPMDIIKEWEKYRQLGTIEEIKNLISESEEEFNMLMDYRALGTVEELREAMEKQRVKKGITRKSLVSIHNKCPACGYNFFGNIPSIYCPKCGQNIDWSNEE